MIGSLQNDTRAVNTVPACTVFPWFLYRSIRFDLLSHGDVEASLAALLLPLPLRVLRLSLPVQRAALRSRPSHFLAIHPAFDDLLLPSLRAAGHLAAGGASKEEFEGRDCALRDIARWRDRALREGLG